MSKSRKIFLPDPVPGGKHASYAFPRRNEKRGVIPKPEIDSLRPRWAFHRMDWHFSSGLNARSCKAGPSLSSGTPKVECCFHLLSESLKSFESLTWGEIRRDDATGSHFINLSDLEKKNKEAADRFCRILIHEGMEQLFCLRLGSRERLWGIVLSDGTFEALWYDPMHQIWPTQPRGT